MDLAVIILNYKNAKDTIECMTNVRKSEGIHCHILVVDNASNDGSVDEIKRHLEFDDVLVEAKENGGYAAGNNLGLEAAIQRGFEFFCILNNDVIVYPDTLAKLTQYLMHHPEVGIVGPGICTYENVDVLESAGSLMNFNNGKINRFYTGKNPKEIVGLEISCDYVGGACMVFSQDLIKRIGFLPENYFLFFEENEWCYKARQAGKKVICYGNSLVIHKGSATINKFSGLSEYYTYRNMVLFIRRNGKVKNKLIFYPYIWLFVIKSGITKPNGWRYFRYIRDGFLEKDTFLIRGDSQSE